MLVNYFEFKMIYSAGRNCPICFDSSDLIFLKNVASNQIFFACYACGCAWQKPPEYDEDFELLSPADFVPDGFVPASLTDIKLNNLAALISENDSDIVSKEYSANDLLELFQ